MEKSEDLARYYILEKRKANAWSGVTSYQGTSHSLQPCISKKTRKLNTGLSEKDEKRLEKLLQLKEGGLSKLVDSRGYVISNFWKEFRFEIDDKPVKLDTTNAVDELVVRLAKASSLVIDGYDKPSSTALYRLYSEEEVVKERNKARSIKSKAFSYYANMSPTEKVDYCISKGKNVSDVSTETIDNLVGKDVEGNPSGFLNWINQDIYKKKVVLYKYIQAGIISNKNNIFTYEDVTLGNSEESAISFLERAANQKIKQGIIAMYEQIQKAESLEKV